jgi:hypothetical protein
VVRLKDTDDRVHSFMAQWLEGFGQSCDATTVRIHDVVGLFSNPRPLRMEGSRERRAEILRRWLNPECQDDTCPAREKRQIFFGLGILLGVGIMALGTYLFSSAKLLDMSVAIDSGPNDETIKVLQEHELKTTVNAAAMNHTKLALERLTLVTTATVNLITVIEEVMAVQFALNRLVREVDRILDGVEELSHLTFSPNLISPSRLRASMRVLRERLSLRKLVVLPTQGHEFYELQVSFIYFSNHTLRSFIHVPAYYSGSLLDMYEYVPCPIRVAHDRFFLPNPKATILAVDPSTGTFFRTMTRSALGLCRQSGSKYYCPGQNFYKKEITRSCLMNLFQNRLDGIADTCPFVPLTSTEDYLVQLSAEEFLLYQSRSNRVTVRCEGTLAPQGVSFQGLRKLRIPAGCRANTLRFSFDGEVDVLVQDNLLAPHFQHAANLSSFFPMDLLSSEIDDVLSEVDMIGSTEGVKVKDLVKMLTASRHQQLFRFSLGVGGGLLVLLVLGLVLYWYCCRRKSASSSCVPCIKRRRLTSGQLLERQAELELEAIPPGLHSRTVSQHSLRPLAEPSSSAPLFPQLPYYDRSPSIRKTVPTLHHNVDG